jgi:hypothetical protein
MKRRILNRGNFLTGLCNKIGKGLGKIIPLPVIMGVYSLFSPQLSRAIDVYPDFGEDPAINVQILQDTINTLTSDTLIRVYLEDAKFSPPYPDETIILKNNEDIPFEIRAFNPQIPTEPTEVNEYPIKGAEFNKRIQVLSPDVTIYGTVHRTKEGESPIIIFISPGKPNLTLDSVYVIGDGNIGTNQSAVQVNESTTADNLTMRNCYVRDCALQLGINRSDCTIEKGIFRNCRTGIYTKNPSLVTNSVFILPKTLYWGMHGRIIVIGGKLTSGNFDILNTYVYTEDPNDPTSLEQIIDPAIAEQYVIDLRTSATYRGSQELIRSLAPDINFTVSEYPHSLFPGDSPSYCFTFWKGYE